MIPVEKNKADAVKIFIGSVKEASASIEVNDKIVNFVSNSFNKMKKISERKLEFFALDSDIIFYKKQYQIIIPKSYQEKYSFEDGNGSYPWLWFNFKKSISDAKFRVSILKDGKPCVFVKSVAHEGISSFVNDTTLLYEGKVNEYISFELVKDLQLNRDLLLGIYTIVLSDENGNEEQLFDLYYTNKIETLELID